MVQSTTFFAGILHDKNLIREPQFFLNDLYFVQNWKNV